MILLAVHLGCSIAMTAWIWAGNMIMVFRDHDLPAARAIYHELRPLYWWLVIGWLGAQALGPGVGGWTIFTLAFWALNWWLLKDAGDDDRWKRRRKKLAEQVKVLGDRLVVAPVEGGAS